MIAPIHILLAPLILSPSLADAFATVQISRRAAINDEFLRAPSDINSWRTDARSSTPSQTQLFEQEPSESMTSESSNTLLDQITTVVGKSASSLVSGSFFVLLAYQRDAVILTLWIGSILNAVLSKVAKKILNHERPASLQDNDTVKLKPSDGGMPSSHAMSLSFISTVIAGGVVPEEYRLIAGLALAAYSAIALRYRVVIAHLHTFEQVAVGLVLGVGNALAWLRFGVGNGAGPVLSWVRDNCVSAETGLFPYSALSVPIVVGILVVGSFERRIELWMKNRRKEE